MPIEDKYKVKSSAFFRDTRSWSDRLADWLTDVDNAIMVYSILIVLMFLPAMVPGSFRFQGVWDLNLVIGLLYLRWFRKRDFKLPFKIPAHAAPLSDPRNNSPGGKKRAEGILFIGNDRKTQEEVWISDSDARTHILFLGTTGSGKTEGLKALATNSLTWGSGFVYVDGKADTGLWGGLYALSRRFGRDDDLLCINYMTGNSDSGSSSNTMNPFSSGSASYLVQMLVSLMPEGGGDNAMWKERAISLIGALMPALTYQRDHQHLLLDIGVVGDHIELKPIISLSRRQDLPAKIIKGIKSYLDTLPGYIDEAFDDDGNEKPPSPDSPVYDLSVARQQHGYLSMQFTRSLQSLASEYSYIFKAQLADVDVIDIVLNRRMLVVMIPALEKSGDEAANLGKIVAASIKGMMGSTLGATIEGSWETAIENKVTNSSSPYMTIFDEVGYYTAQGMAVMAAQARSLGFSLVFAAQDLPAMEKRVKEEARSIAGNCNLKIFGKLEDPTGTKEFFEKTVGSDSVMQVKSRESISDSMVSGFSDAKSVSIESKGRSSYEALKEQREGQVTMLFAELIVEANMLYVNPGKARALRIQKMLPVPEVTPLTEARDRMVGEVTNRFTTQGWTAANAAPAEEASPELMAMVGGYEQALESGLSMMEAGAATVGCIIAGGSDATGAGGKAENVAAGTDGKPASQMAAPQMAAPKRAPLDAAMPTPTEQDIARMAAPAKTVLEPFSLPVMADADSARLKSIAGSISGRLFADGKDNGKRKAG